MSKNCLDFKRDYGALTEIVSPLEISDCVLWLDAQDETTLTLDTFDNVDLWADKSTEGNDFSTVTAIKPKFLSSGGVGSSKSVEFSGGDKMEPITSFQVGNGICFFVIKAMDLGANSIFLDDGTYSLRYEQWNNTGLMGYTHYGVADYTSAISSNYGVDDMAIFKKESGTTFIEVQNNIAAGQQINTGGDKPIPIARLGGRGTNPTVDSFKGFVAEAIVYDRLITNQESALVQNYLKNRWGF